ncbi:MAG: M48 family metalloprotease [bacterium]
MRRARQFTVPLLSMAVLWALTSCAEVERVTKALETEKGQSILKGTATALSGLLPIGPTEERAIGGAMATQVVARYGGLYENPALFKYVNLIGKAVAMTSDRPELNYTFAVINSNRVNAFATPGGYVFVTKGLLRRLRSEAELACVLGHEIAHITQKHILTVIRRSRAVSGLARVTLASLNQNPEKFDEMIKEGMKSLFEEGLDRNMEHEADKVGADFCSRVGYDPSAARDYLLTIQSLRPQEEDEILLTTHPSGQERLDELDEFLLNREAPPTGWARLERRYRRAKAQGRI